MQIIETVDQMMKYSRDARAAGRTIAMVPTMGYLHAGHASLMHEGRKRADLLITSIFVNPTQFGAGEDFDSYPRDLQRDTEIAVSAGVDVIFAPKASDMYPRGYETYINVENITDHLCGASRPGHFRGVTTVVAKLFNICKPHCALFGKKDYQQLAVIRRMVTDLNLDVDVIGMPIVREADGLAMSSRNAYLSPEERLSALCLSRGLRAARAAFNSGERLAHTIRAAALSEISAEPSACVDYVEVRNGTTLEKDEKVSSSSLVALAVRIGKTRLIDNCVLGEDD